MEAGLRAAYDFGVGRGATKKPMDRESKQARVGAVKVLREATGLNLPENADSSRQREILDALPVLVFLEQAGKIVFANAEARQMMGLTEGDWAERPVEDVLWGLFPGTAEPVSYTHLTLPTIYSV